MNAQWIRRRRERFRTLVPGELVLVRYGTDGTQLAQVERPVRGNPRKVYVRKFLRNSRRWTKPVTIRETDLVDPSSERAKKARKRILRETKAAKGGAPLPIAGFQRGLGFEVDSDVR